MNAAKSYRKVTLDLLYEQGKWSAWFLGIIIAFHYVIRYFLPDTREHIGGFFEFSRSSSGIFLLVCGILSAYGFMQYYVHHGLTRKNMFKGTALAAAGLSVILTLAVLLVNGIEYLVAQQFPGSVVLANTGIDGNLFAEAGIFAVSIYLYFLIGWLISIGYYRFGWLIGFGFIALALIAVMLHDYFWGGGAGELIPWVPNVASEAVPLIGTFGSLALVIVLLAGIYALMKRVAIKM